LSPPAKLIFGVSPAPYSCTFLELIARPKVTFLFISPTAVSPLIAESLKFHGDKDSWGWQPVAGSAPQQSRPGLSDHIYLWILIGNVPPTAQFDAKRATLNRGSASP